MGVGVSVVQFAPEATKARGGAEWDGGAASSEDGGAERRAPRMAVWRGKLRGQRRGELWRMPLCGLRGPRAREGERGHTRVGRMVVAILGESPGRGQAGQTRPGHCAVRSYVQWIRPP